MQRNTVILTFLWTVWYRTEYLGARQMGKQACGQRTYPSLTEMNQKLHDMHVHSMVSVWPNMNSGTEDYEEMKAAGHLFMIMPPTMLFLRKQENFTGNRRRRSCFPGGFDSWWCDSTEPLFRSGLEW